MSLARLLLDHPAILESMIWGMVVIATEWIRLNITLRLLLWAWRKHLAALLLLTV